MDGIDLTWTQTTQFSYHVDQTTFITREDPFDHGANQSAAYVEVDIQIDDVNHIITDLTERKHI